MKFAKWSSWKIGSFGEFPSKVGKKSLESSFFLVCLRSNCISLSRRGRPEDSPSKFRTLTSTAFYDRKLRFCGRNSNFEVLENVRKCMIEDSLSVLADDGCEWERPFVFLINKLRVKRRLVLGIQCLHIHVHCLPTAYTSLHTTDSLLF